jgi:hypothetical protein
LTEESAIFEANELANHVDHPESKNSNDQSNEQIEMDAVSNEKTSLPEDSAVRSNTPRASANANSSSGTVGGEAWKIYLEIQDLARSGQLERATELLDTLQNDSRAVGMGAQHILQGYFRRLMADSLRSRRDDAVLAAEQLVQRLEERGLLEEISRSKCGI